MKRSHLFLLFTLLVFSACSSTKQLRNNEYLLTKNSVKMEDVKGVQFDNLNYLLRPEPNKKFMGFINIKTMAYSSGQPKIKKDGTIKDSKFRRWIRESIGEPPVLLDSSLIDNSITQIGIAMKKLGYFNSETEPKIVLYGPNNKKAKVVYHVTANHAYYIRNIQYSIDIPEYRKVIILDSANSLIKKGALYNEETLAEERNRITNLLKNNGFFHASNTIITMEVDTFNSYKLLDRKGNRTIAIDIQINFDNIKNPTSKEDYLYRYTFKDIFVHTNYDFQLDSTTPYDTVRYQTFRNKEDSTTYFFITPHSGELINKRNKIVKDFKYKTISDILFTKKGWPYTQTASANSYRRLNELGNFNIINVELLENFALRDTLNKTGVLDVSYKLTRRKLHSFSTELNIRTDKSNISFTYTNRNIFKGAEHLNINAYGNFYYYDWLKKEKTIDPYAEIGLSVSLDFPRLFAFRQTQKIEAVKYSTSILAGANYSWYYRRLMLNTSITYRWSPNYNINHSLTPINIVTIDSSKNIKINIAEYPQSYQQKFQRSFILSAKYMFDYLIPISNRKHNLRLTLDLESSGLLLTGLNGLANLANRNDKIWTIANYNYSAYEKGELNIRYNYTINKNNSFASRLNMGLAYPMFNSKAIPFERSFFLGGANSMRAWGFRTLGPGSYNPSSNDWTMERTGDIKLELNLEYRGTIYKAFKYGLFADMGNVWMAKKYDDMPGAEFKFDRFYKEIALCIGAGIRLDFNFFLIRLDYGIPLFDPSRQTNDKWINNSWLKDINTTEYSHKKWGWGQGFQFAIGYAF